MFAVNLNDFIAYTDWERKLWYSWFLQHGEQVLKIGVGPHSDGRFQTVGDMVRHIFSAEKRYAERLSGQPLTDTAAIPTDNVEALFQFGAQSRKEFRAMLNAFPAGDWDTPREFKILTSVVQATPRKIAVHVLVHEIRHWAQVATMLRFNGLKGDFHDFLFSPVLGSESAREQNQSR